MSKILVVLLPVFATLTCGLALAKSSGPSHYPRSHKQCFKVGSLIQVGATLQCSVPVVANKETMRFCVDHDALSYYQKTPQIQFSNFELSLIKGDSRVLVRERFASRMKIAGESTSYIYSHAKKLNEFSDEAFANFKVDVIKAVGEQTRAQSGRQNSGVIRRVVMQNQPYCF